MDSRLTKFLMCEYCKFNVIMSFVSKKNNLCFLGTCIYKNIEFVGLNLTTLMVSNFEECKLSCSNDKGCSFFTLYTNNKCNLIGKQVDIRKKSGVFSGAMEDVCSK
jgi:hypothetical protein